MAKENNSNESKAVPPIPAEELRKAGSFVRDMHIRGSQPDVKFIEPPKVVKADADIISRFWPIGSQYMLRRYRLQLANNVPYRIVDSYYPSDLFEELLKEDIGNKPLFEWMEERHKLAAKTAHEDVTVRQATDKEVTLLGIKTKAPILEMRRTVFAHTGRIIEWANIVMPPEKYIFSYEYSIADWYAEDKLQQNEAAVSSEVYLP